MAYVSYISVLLVALSFRSTESAENSHRYSHVSNNKFALDIYQALRNTSSNIVVSPISLQIVLAMAQQGAGGATADEISKVLHQTGENTELLDSYKSLIAGLKSPILKLATKMFVDDSFSINPKFQSVATDYFLSDVKQVNFSGNPEDSREEINSWVEENTNNIIKDLFPDGTITSSTTMVLANAAYFKAKWKNQFELKYTRDEPFYVSPERTVTVKMMGTHQGKLNHLYSSNLGAQILELPYEEKEYRMILILPFERHELVNVESKLTTVKFLDEIGQLRRTGLDVYLPKFKLEKSMELENVLSKMGMPTAFSERADFSRISNDYFKISNVIQKAFVEVNEEGTKAAAGSGVALIPVSLPPQFHCNHPFIYMIMKGNTILFIGRYLYPEN